MTDLSPFTRLKIGYLMQNGAPDLSQVSGPQLHTTAVIKGLKKQGHIVRAVAIQNHQIGWSDDLQTWRMPKYGITNRKLFQLAESIFRRLQTELKLPFFGLFDSLHFADACRYHLTDYNVLYERHGYMGFGGLIAARWFGIPLVLELNGNILKEIDERNLQISALQRGIGMWITIQTFLAADRIVVVSDALGQSLISNYHIPAEKISVVLNGVDIDLFSTHPDNARVRTHFGLGAGPLVGFVGTFEPWHGVDMLVASFQDVERRHPEAQLMIIGEGPGKEKAVAEANRLGLSDKVKFLGRLPQAEVAALLGVAQVLVAPYPLDYGDIVGTPLKIMEYMATGKGIVASTAPLHEMIEHNVTGLRIAPASVQALADGINRLLEDEELSKTLGQNAAKQARKYSWDRVSTELAGIFGEVINKMSSRTKEVKSI